jgi:phosphoribosyl 1,2-cyclic phosphate phosphodiesterase
MSDLPAMPVRVTMLGCGGSEGVPTPLGDWGKCDPANPRNRRTRVSVRVDSTDRFGAIKTLVIDTSPDFREQMIASATTRIDAILFTHAHADHLHGIDDLRSFNRAQKSVIPGFASAEAAEDIRQRFGYVVEPWAHPAGYFFYRPALALTEVSGPFEAAGIPVIPFRQDHGFGRTLGFRIGNFAYSTDLIGLEEASFEVLEGIDTWILDCLRVSPPHPTHCHLERTLELVERVRPRRTVLTHMAHMTDYEALASVLPAGIEPGWDGLELEVP